MCVADRGKGRRAKLRVVAKDSLSADAANLLFPELFRYEVIKQLLLAEAPESKIKAGLKSCALTK